MSKEAEFDLDAAHRHFAAACFNQAWDLIDKVDRTAEEDEQMIRLSLASHWHWTQRADYYGTNKSVAHWQTSRIYALLGSADNARRYGLFCLEASQAKEIPPFYLGFAYEALARAEAVAGNIEGMQAYLEQARTAAASISEPEERKILLADLATVELKGG